MKLPDKITGLVTIREGRIISVTIGAPGRSLSEIEQLIALRDLFARHLKEYERDIKRRA